MTLRYFDFANEDFPPPFSPDEANLRAVLDDNAEHQHTPKYPHHLIIPSGLVLETEKATLDSTGVQAIKQSDGSSGFDQ